MFYSLNLHCTVLYIDAVISECMHGGIMDSWLNIGYASQ